MSILDSIAQPTLSVQTVYLHESDRPAARELGRDLYRHLTRPPEDPLAGGAGVPVGVGVAADRIDFSAAERMALVPVLGSETFQQMLAEAIERIAEWHERLGPGHVLPVPVSKVWRNVEDRLPGAPLLSELYGAGIRRRKTLDEIVLGLSRLLAPSLEAVRLFVSHAKADLGATQEAARTIHDHVAGETTGQAFFDVTGIRSGEPLLAQLEAAAGRGVFVVVRSDTYSSRIWCQHELLTAKRKGLPTLTVELLENGERRSLAYGGNGPSMVWKGDPAAIVSRAMVEWLRAEHFRRDSLRLVRGAGLRAEVTPLARPPELLDLAQGPLRAHRAQLVLHPDPELSVAEAQVLGAAHPRLRFATPTSVFRRLLSRSGRSGIKAPLAGLQVGISISDSPDADGPEGFTPEHLSDAAISVVRSLIATGAAIAYGGDFRLPGFTQLLVELIQAYNQTAAAPAEYLHSYMAADVQPTEAEGLALTRHHLGPGEELAPEALLPGPPADPGPPPALYLSDMRRVMARHVDARLALGGAAAPTRELGGTGYGGRFPGILEEAWRGLQEGKPLYVLGGYGGAAGDLAALLRGEEVPERLRQATWSDNPRYREVCAEIDADGHAEILGLPGSLDELAEAVRDLGREVLASDEASVRWNGLTVAENHTLFGTRDLVILTTLVLSGLLRRTEERSRGRLSIELVHGSVTQARDLDALAVAAFDDVPLGGAGEAIDRMTGGGASRRRLEGDRLTAVTLDSIGADWLYLASLGPIGDLAGLEERVELAARETAELALRHGFERLGVVAYGGSVVQEVRGVVAAMLRGLASLPDHCSVSWYESDGERFRRIETALEGHDEVKLTTRRLTVEEPPLAAGGADAYLHVASAEGRVTATFLPPSGVGIAATQRREVSEELMASFSAGAGTEGRDTPDLGTLAARGTELARLLLGEEAPALLARCSDVKIVVVHDLPSSKLPFETMAGAGSEPPPAVARGVSRRLAVEGVRSETLYGFPPRKSPLRMLLVVDPRGDLPGARTEGAKVKSILDAFGKQEAERGGSALELTVLRNPAAATSEDLPATRESFLEWLPRVDVLHYCGHAKFSGVGADQSGLYLSDAFLTFEHLGEIEMPRVAFVNSCEAGRVRTVGPTVHEAASFAEHFLRSGVEAYLGTLWRVQDDPAARFAATVYTHLALGQTLEAAVTAARTDLRESGDQDWGNYVMYGDGRFRLVKR